MREWLMTESLDDEEPYTATQVKKHVQPFVIPSVARNLKIGPPDRNPSLRSG
jgi:hypothetical protein